MSHHISDLSPFSRPTLEMGSSSPVRDVQRQFLVNSRDMNRFLEGVSTWSDEVKSEDTAILQDSVEKKNSTLDAVREPHDNAGQGRAGVEYDVAATIDTVDSRLQQEKLFGDACFQQGDYETAKKYYSRCANNRCTASIYANLSLCEMKLQSWAEAETYCSEALRLDPKHLKVKDHQIIGAYLTVSFVLTGFAAARRCTARTW